MVVVILEPILSVVVGVVEVVLRMAQTEKSASAGTAAQRRVVADILFVAVLFCSVLSGPTGGEVSGRGGNADAMRCDADDENWQRYREKRPEKSERSGGGAGKKDDDEGRQQRNKE